MKHTDESYNALVIPKMHYPYIGAFLILGAFFIFISGYFLGKNSSAQELLGYYEQDEFADHMHHAMSFLYPYQQAPQSKSQDADDESQESLAPEVAIPESPQADSEVKKQAFRALLAGFGSKIGAESYVNKLKKQGINTTIIKRTGVLASSNQGKKRERDWYQVSTDSFYDKKALEFHIEKINRIAPIHDAQIVKAS